ncbi:hypothetical protein BT96DRAFT_1025544 [Gymnopus androsaceus JB14]|uniref:Uncharacterized protein n=1 Tax=Gymnopus androsaceus JB14 TaxID=1447944 RepID=A0A6A4GS09_9AGAR|nr:hypothetical protein BT96DRAFT_1025544 [Gymnopus androsaceus JB14]
MIFLFISSLDCTGSFFNRMIRVSLVCVLGFLVGRSKDASYAMKRFRLDVELMTIVSEVCFEHGEANLDERYVEDVNSTDGKASTNSVDAFTLLSRRFQGNEENRAAMSNSKKFDVPVYDKEEGGAGIEGAQGLGFEWVQGGRFDIVSSFEIQRQGQTTPTAPYLPSQKSDHDCTGLQEEFGADP